MPRLGQRLSAGHSMKNKLYRFITGMDSPVVFIVKKLEEQPLIAGTGEFGMVSGNWEVESDA